MKSKDIVRAMVYMEEESGGGGGGTKDYNQLSNKPKLNDSTIEGDKTSADYGLANQASVTALYNTTEQLRVDIEATDAELTQFKSDVEIDLGGLQEAISTKADSDAVYTKNEMDNLLSGKLGSNIEVGVEKWYGTYTENGVTYQVYSKVVKIDALPSTAGITNYPHGITGIKQILSAYGFTTDGFVLNAPRQNVQDNIAIYQVSKNNTTGSIAIEVGKDRSSKQAYVCLIYAKNN